MEWSFSWGGRGWYSWFEHQRHGGAPTTPCLPGAWNHGGFLSQGLRVFHLFPLFKYFVHFIIRSSAFVLLSCRNSLYILEINLLSEKWFASIFSHSVGCLFTVSFLCCTETFFVVLTKSHLSIFAFIVCAFHVISETLLPRIYRFRRIHINLYFYRNISKF